MKQPWCLVASERKVGTRTLIRYYAKRWRIEAHCRTERSKARRPRQPAVIQALPVAVPAPSHTRTRRSISARRAVRSMSSVS